MPTTSNFGWTTPADTDLVKDGAAAIRTLGNGIDTSFLDLKGGTSGQVLSKASNTDLDFTWVAQDDSNAIQNAIVDAKGDLISATAADTPARLAVGANGTVLTADSAEATGLKWATPASSDSYTQLASVSLTGAQTDITSISGSYKRLILVIRDFYVAGAGDNLVLRFNNSSTANSYHQSGVTRAGAIFNGGSYLWVTYNTYVGSNQSNMFWMEIEDYANTVTWKVASAFNGYYDGSNDQSEMFVYNWENTSAITEINLLATGGNLSGGTAILYGVK